MNLKTITYFSVGLIILLCTGVNKVQAEKISQATQEKIQRAREPEGKNLAGLVNRTQQSYHFERQTFADSITLLGITANSNYYGQPIITAEPNKATVIVGATQEGLRSYSGAITYDANGGEYSQILCQTDAPSQTAPPPVANGAQLICPPGTTAIR